MADFSLLVVKTIKKYNGSYVGYFMINNSSEHYTYIFEVPNGNRTITAYVKQSDHFSFKRWKIDSNDSISYRTTKSISVSVDKSQSQQINGIITAEFKGVDISVTFDKQGGSQGSDSVTAEFDAAMPTITPPTLSGAVFQGYYTGTNGTGDKYYNSDGTSEISNCSLNSGSTLYAHWKKSFTVHYNSNGGSGSISDSVVDIGSTGQLKTQNFTSPTSKKKINDSSKVWNTSADGTGSYYAENATIDNTSGVGGEVTLYAQWVSWTSKTVTYDGNGGTSSKASDTVSAGNTLTTLATASRTGYTFSGWYTSKIGGTLVTSVSNEDGSGGTVNLYAQWTINTYTVTVSAGTGGTVSPSGENRWTYGTTHTISASASTGYNFSKWSDNNTSSSRTITVTGDATYTATFSLKTYTVSFNKNGADGTQTMSGQSFQHGVPQNIKSNVFTYTDKKFAGWAKSVSGSVEYTDGASATFTAAATLYAKWVPWKTKVVTYHKNDGGSTTTTQSISPADGGANYGAALASNTFNRTGHTFSNWNTKADGSGTTYIAGNSFIYNTGNEGSPLNLYAIWTPYKTTVVFNANGASGGSMSNQVFDYGVRQSLTANAFSWLYHTFAGWATNSGGSVAYTNGQSVSFIPSTEAETKNLYAVWTHDACKVSFNSNGGSGTMSDQSFNKGSAQNINSNTFTRSNYAFAGWATSSNGSVVYADGASATFTQDTTLYARWYTPLIVSYDLNGGSGSISPTTVAPNETGKTLATVSSSHWPTGKKFDCWKYANNTYSEGASITNSPTLSTQNITMTAQWKDNRDLVVYYYSNGTLVQTQTITPSAGTGTVQSISARTGYNFGNYASSSERASQGIVDYYVGNTLTNSGAGGTLNLHAIWTAKTYTVSFDPSPGYGGSTSSYVSYGSVISNIVVPSRSGGYSFGGYWSGSGGTGTQYVNSSGVGITSWMIDGSRTLYAKWDRIRHSTTVSKGNNSVPCTILVTGDGVSEETSGSSVTFNGAEGSTYTITVRFSSSFLARKWVATTLGEGISFSKSGDYDYVATLNIGSSDSSHSISFVESALYSIVGSSTVSDRISGASVPSVSLAPSADGEGKWFSQQITASHDNSDSRVVIGSWSAVNTETGASYDYGNEDTFRFTVNCDTAVTAVFVPAVATVSCALHSASSSVVTQPTCVVTDAYVEGEVHVGDTVVFTAAEKSGFTFVDWVDSSGSIVSTERIYTTVLSGSIALYARYSVPIRLILVPNGSETGTVSINGETSSTDVTKNVTLGTNASISCESEYFFGGWYTDFIHTSPAQYSQEDSFAVTSSVTLYAWIVSSAFYNYVAIYNYDQREGHGTYDVSLGEWTYSAGVVPGLVTAVTKSEYESAVSGTALANGVFLKIVGIQRIWLSVTPKTQLGLHSVAEYARADTPGEPIETFSTGSFSIVANANLMIRSNWGNPVEKTATVGYCTGSSGRGTAYVDGGSTSRVSQGGRCEFTVVPKNGSKFVGWYSDADGENMLSSDKTYSMTVNYDVTVYVKLIADRNAICEWEGSEVNKMMRWKSKTYVSSRPFSPSTVRVDALGYYPDRNLTLTVGMFSAPDSSPSGTVTLGNISGQDMRRIPKMRNEKYMTLTVEADSEVDAIVVGTSSAGVVA